MKQFLSVFVIFISLCVCDVHAQKLFVDFVTPKIVRVRWIPDSVKNAEDNGTGVCVWNNGKASSSVSVDSKVDKKTGAYILSSSEIKVEIINQTLSFFDKQTGKLLLSEDTDFPRVSKTQSCRSHEAESVVQERIIYDEKSAHTEETANGQVTVKNILHRDTIGMNMCMRTYFKYLNNDALYGLGAHMEDYLNLRGKTLYLTQHNLKATVPMIVSTRGYGLLFDAGCAMKFASCEFSCHGEKEKHTPYWYMEQEACKMIDYYFIKGETMSDVISGYHYLTGNVSMMPRWLFGYTQSKERYVSSEDILKTLREYRRRHVPIDMIVQDWNYWPQGWGYMKMNPKYYPDPKALADSVHAMNAKLMVSIWPNPQWCPEAEDFKSRGYMLEHDVYDVFNPSARKHYWKYANDEFFSRGFDAWWCDSSEPLDGDWNKTPEPINSKPYGWDDHERRWNLNKDVLSESLGAERSNLYSLYHSMGIYENQRLTTSDKRVVNLTRSTYAGQQRYGTVVWNGDTHASWKSFKQQIPSGLNYMATGNPYWTVDVGSFFTRNNGRQWFYKGEFQNGVKSDQYKEYYVRMFQWATFLPMLRSHGSDTPREIWQFGEPGTRYYDAIHDMIAMRYQMIPYIYSMAARQTNDSYTMARLLAFDFPYEDEVLDLKDEYMFGDILVCPVTDEGATTRKVYLPGARVKDVNKKYYSNDKYIAPYIGKAIKNWKPVKWYDYWTGETVEGGQWVDAAAPINRIPLYVKAGTIIPTTEVAEYAAAQIGKPVTINIYPGADAEFTLYEDEGDNYNFERGESSLIPISWKEKTGTLTIGLRKGQYKGMKEVRTFILSTPAGKTEIRYDGHKVSKKLMK